MNSCKFGVTGTTRKNLVKAISEITDTAAVYQGVPSMAYRIGDYEIDRAGSLTGPDIQTLLVALRERGFEPKSEGLESDSTPLDGAKTVPAEEITTSPESDSGQMEESAGGTSAADDTPPVDSPADDILEISVPDDGFTPEKLDILRRLIDSKAPLIKKALCVEDLPIQVDDRKIGFAWFRGNLDADSISAYSMFVTALCDTAKRKTRITAQP